jgi:hypothetical protein
VIPLLTKINSIEIAIMEITSIKKEADFYEDEYDFFMDEDALEDIEELKVKK